MCLQLAPPPTALQDFEYHWKQVKNFYGRECNSNFSPQATSSHLKCHLNDTHIPFHLEEMLQILIREEAAVSQPNEQFVLDFMLSTRPLDILTDLAVSDSPPGATVCILNWVRRFLTCLRNPCLYRESIFQPVQVSPCQASTYYL